MRITKKILENQIGFLAKSMNTDTEKLALDCAYGGYQLVIIHMNAGRSESDLSRRLPAHEMYELLYALNNLDRRQLLKKLDTQLEYR